jgi:hypothetical protein
MMMNRSIDKTRLVYGSQELHKKSGLQMRKIALAKNDDQGDSSSEGQNVVTEPD